MKLNKKDNPETIITDLYYNLTSITSNNIKTLISSYQHLFPMYDIVTENIVLVKKTELYEKLILLNFRPINKTIYNNILNSKSIHLNKSINFLNNFDLDLLESTFIKNVYDTMPLTHNISECIRPSYLPIMHYSSPYYSKTELTYLALNNDLFRSISNDDSLCSVIQQNDITNHELLEHQTYIRENLAEQYIKFYSFLGSTPFNYYLRYPELNKKDVFHEKHLSNLYNILINSPKWNKSYYFYRWINNDSHLRHLSVGDTYIDNGFISTTRKPFVDINEHYFGYILIKIKVPPNVAGTGLAIEFYSHFQSEQEILFPPSKFKLISSSNLKYYHPNSAIVDKINNKYEFEWISHVNPLTSSTFNSSLQPSNIHEITIIDFEHVKYTSLYGNKYELFFNDLLSLNCYKQFKTKIGNELITFNVTDIPDGPYSKFFLLNNIDERTAHTHKNFYLLWMNENTGEINMTIEIGEFLCVNYYFRFSGMETKILGNYTYNDILDFLHKLSLFFNVKKIIICPDHSKYWNIIDKSCLSSSYVDLHNYHSKQLYISDTVYYNQLIHHYINLKYNTSDYVSDFILFLFNTKNILFNSSKDVFYHLMNLNISDFIADSTAHIQQNSIIHEQYISLILHIASKIINNKIIINIDTNIDNIKIKRSLSILKRPISSIDSTKFIAIYFYISHFYNYLIPHLHAYISVLYNISIDDVFIYNVLNSDSVQYNLTITSPFINLKLIQSRLSSSI